MFAITNGMAQWGGKISIADGLHEEQEITGESFLLYVPTNVKTRGAGQIGINAYCSSMGMYMHTGVGLSPEYETNPCIIHINYHCYSLGTARDLTCYTRTEPYGSIPQLAWIEAPADTNWYGRDTPDICISKKVIFRFNPFNSSPFATYTYVQQDDDKRVDMVFNQKYTENEDMKSKLNLLIHSLR
jgi:hypothetical protein